MQTEEFKARVSGTLVDLVRAATMAGLVTSAEQSSRADTVEALDGFVEEAIRLVKDLAQLVRQ